MGLAQDNKPYFNDKQNLFNFIRKEEEGLNQQPIVQQPELFKPQIADERLMSETLLRPSADFVRSSVSHATKDPIMFKGGVNMAGDVTQPAQSGMSMYTILLLVGAGVLVYFLFFKSKSEGSSE